MRGRRRAAHGFTMIEALVALAITAGVVTAFYDAMSASLMLERRSAAHVDAARVAAEVIDSVGVGVPLEPGVHGGKARGYDWSLSIVPVDQVVFADGRPAAGSSRLLAVRVEVRSPATERPMIVTTMRLTSDALR